jgi:hypothetical protein
MPSLGFSIGTNFKREAGPSRRGVGKLQDIDALVARKERRIKIWSAIVGALFSAGTFGMLAVLIGPLSGIAGLQ